jgi:adenylate cyclase
LIARVMPAMLSVPVAARTYRQQRLRAMLFLLVALGTTGVMLGADALHVLSPLERQSIDARFSIRGNQNPPKDIVVVQVDDITFDELGLQWPFPRSVHAKLLDRLRKDGAKMVAFDVQITEQTVPKEDLALYDAVARMHGRIVLATTEVDAQGHTNVFGGDANLRRIGTEAGNSNFPTDPGGVIRHMPYEVEGLRSFAVEAAERTLGHAITPFDTNWIDFYGPPDTIPSVSYSRALNGKTPPGLFRGKIVVVGSSAPSLQDIHAVSTGSLMSGPELQANAIETAVHGFPLQSMPRELDVFLIVLLGLITPACGILFSRAAVPIGAGLGTAALFTVLAQVAFDQGRVVAFIYPLAALIVSTVGAIGVQIVITAFERERVRDVFSRFVPEQVVDQVLARTDADLRLGGQRLVATLLFSDLRGFTSTAEHMPAEKVIEVLNVYLSEMSDAILANNGTLVTYMGDGIMAAFGAPIEHPEHAAHALGAAREMLFERLPRFNEWLRNAGVATEFKMGIGLNTGPIMSGNVGHERRLEYTTIGDTTNTASRIEGLTKGTPYSLFVAESTHALLPPELAEQLVYVDEFEVRGRVEHVKLWGMTADGAKPESAYAAEGSGERGK